MRRGILCVCVSIALVGSYDAVAQGKKKGKEMEPVISKRGKLIFEDDFSGKGLEWNFNPEDCEWKIVKGAAVTKSSTKTTSEYLKLKLFRAFPDVQGAVFEMRILVPMTSACSLVYGSSGSLPYPTFDPRKGRLAALQLRTFTRETGYTGLAESSLLYAKPGWVTVMFEVIGEKYALTVDGKTITCDCPPSEERKINRIEVLPIKTDSEIFALDDVKVWEALPKDEGEKDDKDKKKK